jgi:hypothetical protein
MLRLQRYFLPQGQATRISGLVLVVIEYCVLALLQRDHVELWKASLKNFNRSFTARLGSEESLGNFRCAPALRERETFRASNASSYVFVSCSLSWPSLRQLLPTISLLTS